MVFPIAIGMATRQISYKLDKTRKNELSETIKTLEYLLAYGVTGNTSGFGPEESRFEP